MIAGELKRIIEGPVSESEEHIAISYGSVDTDKTPYPTVARVSAPRDGGINLEFLIADSTTHDADVMAAVRREVHWLFLEKKRSRSLGVCTLPLHDRCQRLQSRSLGLGIRDAQPRAARMHVDRVTLRPPPL